MPSFPTSNGNYKHFFSIARHYVDDVVGSSFVIFCKFVFYTTIIIVYTIFLIIWRLLIDYGYYHNQHFHDSDTIQFVYNILYMLFLTIFNTSIIVLLTSGISRSQICYQLIIGSTIYNKCCQYISFMILVLLILTTIGMIPYICLYFGNYNLGFSQIDTVKNINCKLLQCQHINLIYIINHYLIPTISPSLGIIIWYLFSLCLCPKQLTISYNNEEETVTMPPQQINHIVDFAKVFRDTITGSAFSLKRDPKSLRKSTKLSIFSYKSKSRQTSVSRFSNRTRNSTFHKSANLNLFPQPPSQTNDYHILPEDDVDNDYLQKYRKDSSNNSTNPSNKTRLGVPLTPDPITPVTPVHELKEMALPELVDSPITTTKRARESMTISPISINGIQQQKTKSDNSKIRVNLNNAESPSLNSLGPPSKYKTHGYIAVCYALLFTVCYACFIIVIHIYMDMKHSVFKKHVGYVFITMRIMIFIFQFILTRIGRKCDELIHQKDKYNCFISIEYLMEWFCTITYYVMFRYLIAYYTPSISIYFMLLILHIMFELPLSMKLLYDYYFDITSIWIDIRIKRRNKFLYHLFVDNSNLEEWRNRCSMDIVLRFYASILSTIIQTLILVSVNEKDFHIVYLYDNQYHAVLGYILISNVIELIHFLGIYAFSKINVLSPFVNYISSMTPPHQFIHLTVFATALVILLS